MRGINRALEDSINLVEKSDRYFSNIGTEDVPCIFISYQRKDEEYATEISEYIMSKQIDVYFDLSDKDLKLQNERANPKGVTDAIRKGLNKANYMLIIVSPDTYRSLWVPFEVGYAYDNKGENMKLLRHKGISKTSLPGYLEVKELLNGSVSLNNFLDSVRKRSGVYESLIRKGETVKSFSDYRHNPLNKYLDNE